MKLAMLGWEYPPHISGGLGVACEGLTNALSRRGVEVTFVVPHLYGEESRGNITLLDASQGSPKLSNAMKTSIQGGLQTIQIPAFLKPYWSASEYQSAMTEEISVEEFFERLGFAREDSGRPQAKAQPKAHYGRSIFDEVDRYALNVMARLAEETFDIVHAHDWMTFPAGITLAATTGKPLIVHVHSLEFDRSGEFGDPKIHAIEYAGLQAATRIIAVSHFTKRLIHERYDVPLDKISVIHNGTYQSKIRRQNRDDLGHNNKRIVLFLGRVTMQKGPEYFIEAAKKVLSHVPDVMFVMAGSGDQLDRMVESVRESGLKEHFFFTGFLKKDEVEKMFSIADLYVMPSVSEPFGIAALEAINYEVPVIISKQSGVSEVIRHALKVDFWDTDRMADLIINVLLHPELSSNLLEMSQRELSSLHWESAAAKADEVYQEIISRG